MVVQHNLRAMNSNRMLGLTANVQSKSTEKLSSGYKINRAADDAAGLSISEKMRKQIRGLSQASLNASDGISAVQTAEGALNEVQDMLQRMNELAVKASNGSMSENDRSYIQNEVDALLTEIDRVAETTKFNETYLLKGDTGTKTVNLEAHDAGIKGTMVDNGNGKSTFTVDALVAGDKVDIGGKEYEIINGAEQKIAQDYSYTAASNATAKISLDGWTTGDALTINFGTAVTVTGAAGTLDDPSEILYALNNNDNFNKFATATYDETTKELIITANDETMKADDLASKFTSIKVAGTTVTYAANAADIKEMVTGPVKEEYKGDFTAELYAKGGTKALTEEEAKAELAKGNQLYTTATVDYDQTEATHKYVDTTGASVTLDLTGFAAGNIVTFDNVTITGVATTLDDVKEVAEAFNINATFKEKYVASYDLDKNTLTITSKDTTVSADDFKALLTAANPGAASILTDDEKVVANEAVDNFEGDFSKPLYAYAGTEALTEEEAKAALKEGKTLYTSAAKVGENQIVASKAYDLMKAELLKANQIGDTLGTAAIENVAREGQAATEIEALSSAYTAGQQASVTLDLSTLQNAANNTITFTDADNGIAAITIKGNDAGIAGDGAKIAEKLNKDESFAKKYVASYDADSKKLTIAEKEGEESGTAARGTTMKNMIAASLGAAPATVAAVEGENNSVAAKWDDAALAKVELYTEDGINKLTVDELKKAFADGAVLYEKAADAPNNVFNITTGSAEVANTLSFNLHVGADADMTNKINVGIEAMTAEYLGVANLDVTDITGMDATYAVDAIQDAIQKISTQRSALGAVQNRLEHTIANLDNVVENTTAAESQIRDTDMATEMVKFSNNNILAQAGQAMLAQANQANQGVLSLLG